MAGIGLSDIHIDAALSNLSVGYRPEGHIADQIFPIVDVSKQSNVFYVWTKENFKAPETARGTKGTANIVDYSVSSLTYFCKWHSLRHDESTLNYSNEDAAIRLRETNAMMLMDNMKQAWEVRVALTVTSTSNVGSSVTLVASTQWDNYTDSTPITDMRTGIDAVRATTGKKANTVVIGYQVWSKLQDHPDIMDILSPQGSGRNPTPQALANYLNIDRVLIGEAIYNTANEGGTDSFSDVWGKNVACLYVAPRPGIMVPSYGYTFQWRPEQFPQALSIERYIPTPEKKVEAIETHQFVDEKVVATGLGYLIASAVG